MFLAHKNQKIFPGFGISLGSTLFFICLIIILPLSALLMQLSHMTLLKYWKIITHPQVLATYKVTLFSALIASIINAFFGMLIVWILCRYKFPGRVFLNGLIDLPFALPTAIAGLTFSKLFSIHGFYGRWCEYFDIKVSNTWIAICIAMTFTSIPFVIRTVQPVLETLLPSYEEVAQTLGATKWKIFRFVIFPELKPAILVGTALSFTRSLGEFGAIIFFSSNIPWKTEVTSLMIYIKLQEFDYAGASAISSVVLLTSLLLLFFINITQNKYNKYSGKN